MKKDVVDERGWLIEWGDKIKGYNVRCKVCKRVLFRSHFRQKWRVCDECKYDPSRKERIKYSKRPKYPKPDLVNDLKEIIK